MADLVSLAEVKSWLGNTPSADDSLLTDLADRVEVILEQVKRRTFAVAATGVVVKADGTGMPYLWLDRPISTLTNVKIGLDAAAPDETLVPGARTIVVQGRRLYRQDGGIFPRGVANVQVTFDAAAQLDLDAKQAVLDGIALVYRGRGSEDASSELAGSFNHALRQKFEQLPSWKAVPARPIVA